MHKVSQHMQNKIAQHQQRREQITWNHKFHCARNSSTFARLEGDACNPRATAAQPNQLFSAKNLPITRKNTMFRANLDIQIAPTLHENEAFVRGCLQIPRVECVKQKLSCEVPFKFDPTQLQSTLLNST